MFVCSSCAPVGANWQSLPRSLRQGQGAFVKIQQGLLCLSRLHQIQCVFVLFFSLFYTCTDTAAPPTFTDTVVSGTSVTVLWDHANKGPCFNHLTFSYIITWYPVVGGVPQKGEGQSVLTGPGATEYIITNLMNDTDYRVELVGFTSRDPIVRSEVATVDFTTEGVYVQMHAGVHMPQQKYAHLGTCKQ